MSNGKEYNGWTNWDTWNIALWFQNDEGLYRSVLDEARGMVDPDTGKISTEDTEWLVGSFFDEGETPDGAFIGNCDWDQIADCVNECLAE